MKSDEIKRAALKYFTIHGYEGASLSKIAEEVGLKKQSLYSHFKSKDDLFLQVIRNAGEVELHTKLTFFNNHKNDSPEKSLYAYLVMVKELFQLDERMKFWLRISFFPPEHLYHVILNEVFAIEDQVMEMLEAKFAEWMKKEEIYKEQPSIPASAFTGIVDALMLELLYDSSPERINEKLESAWTVFWRGISK
ncbi:TetR/AcrR family transcriptional regulator [Paenibacillus sp. N3/727]|uniref:TetR/AcrR family transcriptional regulator n=1 Tax=Paenibacillus sp. N3/727 TaxID=2925845 RepID=UPI001F5323C0|nr:TetR/AcrR family transcriptional regulator [Paenibacillus sp. N3/727]UNK21022.1 TetR/AcrR family transcriptional regulator [Paenibacillus sp. N3/727]